MRITLGMAEWCIPFWGILTLTLTSDHISTFFVSGAYLLYYGRPWPAVYINFVLKIHQIQVLTEPLCRAQASFYALPNNERDTKYRGLTYSARQNCP